MNKVYGEIVCGQENIRCETQFNVDNNKYSFTFSFYNANHFNLKIDRINWYIDNKYIFSTDLPQPYILQVCDSLNVYIPFGLNALIDNIMKFYIIHAT